MGKPAGSASGSNPPWARLGISCKQLAQLAHGLKETTLEIRGKRNLVPNASGKHDYPIGRPNTIDLLNKQALRRYLEGVRLLSTVRVRLLLDGDEMMPRTQQVIWPTYEAEAV